MQNVGMDRQFLDPPTRPAAHPAPQIVHADRGRMVVGENGVGAALQGGNVATAVVFQVRQAVHHQEFIIAVRLHQIARPGLVVIQVIGIADKPDVRFALLQAQRFRHSQLDHADLQLIAVGNRFETGFEERSRDPDPVAVDPAAMLPKQRDGFRTVGEPYSVLFQDIERGLVNPADGFIGKQFQAHEFLIPRMSRTALPDSVAGPWRDIVQGPDVFPIRKLSIVIGLAPRPISCTVRRRRFRDRARLWVFLELLRTP